MRALRRRYGRASRTPKLPVWRLRELVLAAVERAGASWRTDPAVRAAEKALHARLAELDRQKVW